MLGRKSSDSDVLKRASSQLRGEKVPRNSTEEDELQAYLSQMSKKTTGASKENKRTIQLPDGSDISLSDDDFKFKKGAKSGASRYRKNAPETTDKPTVLKVHNTSSSMQSKGMSSLKSSTDNALSKAAALTNSFKNRKSPAKPSKPVVSDSDFDITLSTDDSALRELNQSKGRPKTAHGAQKPQESTGKPKLSKQNQVVGVPWSQSFDKSDDDSLGKGGRRFLKKKPPKGTENMSSGLRASSSVSLVEGGSPTAMKKLRFNLEKGKPSSPERKSTDLPLKPALKTSSSFRSSQETEDFSENVINVASSNSSIVSDDRRLGRGARRYVKKAEVLTISPAADDDDESVVSDDSFKVNLVMDIDSVDPSYTVLQPSSQRRRSKSPESKRPKSPEKKPRTPSPADPFRVSKRRSPSPEKRPSTPDHKKRKSPSPDPFRKRRSSSPEKHRPTTPDRKKRPASPPDPFRSKPRTPSPDQGAKRRQKSSDQKRPKSPEKHRKEKKEKDIFSSMGLQTVDDLLGPKSDSESEAKPVTKKSKSTKSMKKKESDDILHTFGLQTVEDLLGAAPEQSEDDSISMEIPFKSDHSEIVSEYDHRFGEKKREVRKQDSFAYSEDFESSTSEIVTMQSGRTPRQQYSEDFETASETETLKDESESTYSTSSDTYTSRSEVSYTRSSVEIRGRRSLVEVEVQTSEMGPGLGGLSYQWNQSMGRAYASQAYGLGFTDPTPIATHTVSPDALEAMTAYSPCVLALNDMLRQQLALTQQFIANQNRVYESLIGSISTEHHYTTLEDTKRYIEQNRKPRLTFDEALRMVREEMDERR